MQRDAQIHDMQERLTALSDAMRALRTSNETQLSKAIAVVSINSHSERARAKIDIDIHGCDSSMTHDLLLSLVRGAWFSTMARLPENSQLA